MPKLIVIDRNTHTEQVHTFRQDQITLGRSDDCDIVIAERGVSRHHAEILYDRRDYYLVDLGSGNGTLLNGKAIHPQERHFLRTNDSITINSVDIHFIADVAQEPSHFDDEITDADMIEIKMIKKLLQNLDNDMFPSLQVASGEFEGKKVLFTENMSECTVGRDAHCSLAIPDNSISRVHATLARKWGGVAICDLDSKNGTFVNGERVKEKLLADGDQVVLGTIKLIYRNPRDVSLSAIRREYDAVQAPEIPSHSPAAASTTQPESGPAIPDDALPDLFGPEEKPVGAGFKPAPTPHALFKKIETLDLSGMGWILLLVLGAVIFITAMIGMLSLLL